MKFIRDIIAEKTSQIAVKTDLDTGPKPARPISVPVTVPLTFQQPDSHASVLRLSDPLPDEGDSAQFDLLADPGDDEYPSDQTTGNADDQASGNSSGLFDGVWGEDSPAEPDIADPDPEYPEASTADGFFDQPAAESNTNAVMQTIYQSEATPGPTDSQPGSHPGSQPETQPETQPGPNHVAVAGAVRDVLRRDAIPPLQGGPTSDAIGEPAPDPETGAKTNATSEPIHPVSVPAPQAGRARKKAGRVKTRLLGFGNDFGPEPDLFASEETSEAAPQTTFPVAWMVVTSGPGRGTAFTLFNGVSQIGRGESQAVRLDFGDTSISRSNHAAIAYDPEQQKFFLGHGGKANLVRLNGNPVLSTEPLTDGAEIRLGETTLRFVALCGAEFDWGSGGETDNEDARFG